METDSDLCVYTIKGLKASTESMGHLKHGTWAHLVSNERDTKQIRDIVEDGMQIRVGNGRSTRFWLDKWTPDGLLRHRFPRLFQISLHHDYTIEQMGEWRDGLWVWHLQWRRRLYDWEEEELASLHLLLEQHTPVQHQSDCVTWNGAECQKYPIKAIVANLHDSETPLIPREISSYIWSIKVPPRVHLTLWLASLERLKTGDSFVDKQLLDPSQAGCPFGCGNMETNSHVLFTCHFSWCLWMTVLKWGGISGVIPSTCIPFTQSWRRLTYGKRRGKLWSLVLGCVVWSIWHERMMARHLIWPFPPIH